MPKQSSASRRPDRGDLTRGKLLTAAIDVFGRCGFDGASTRMLADAAGVNLQAIAYYFGSKEGLYVAAAEHLVALITAHVGDLRQRMFARLMTAATEPIRKDEANAYLSDLLSTMAGVFLSAESEPWARFVIREQMVPTEAFQRIYGGMMKPMIEVGSRMVAVLLDEDPQSEHVRLRTIALLGSVMVFRVAHAAVLAQLDWRAIGPREVDTVRALVRELVSSLDPRGKTS